MIKSAINDQGIATITFNRDDKRNAINEEMADQILHRLEQAEQDGTRVVILRANPGVSVWCAGHDLTELEVEDLHAENPTLKLSRKIQSVPYPVIGMVEGSVRGGGTILLLCAEIVIAAENANVAIASNKLGIPLSPELHTFWLHVMGMHKTKELLFTAGTITAGDAYHANLYNHVVQQHQPEGFTLEIAKKVTECSAQAIANTKLQLNSIAQTACLNDQIRAGFSDDCTEILSSNDTRARIAALLTLLRLSS